MITSRRCASAGKQRLSHFESSTHVDGSGDDVVAALAHVDVVVGMHFRAETPGRKPGDHLVGVHVGTGPRSRLKDIDRKLRVVLPVGDFQRCRLDGHGLAALEQPKLGIGARCRPLDEPQGTDEVHAASGRPLTGKLSTARWVCAPQSAWSGTRNSPMLSRSYAIIPCLAILLSCQSRGPGVGPVQPTTIIGVGVSFAG